MPLKPEATTIETAPSGSFVNLLDPEPETIHLRDIARALSRIPRFTGHTLAEWPVGNHLLLTEWIGRQRYPDAGPLMQLHWLLHDAHEAYIGDVSTPLKNALDGQLAKITDRLDVAIYAAFDLPFATPDEHAQIKWADRVALYAEARVLLPSGARTWPWPMPDPDDERMIRAAENWISRAPSGDLAVVLFRKRIRELLPMAQPGRTPQRQSRRRD
jgi:hypothetical protein